MSAEQGTPREDATERARIDPWVFSIAAAISLAFVLWGVLDTDGVATVADDVLSWIIATFGWVFVLSTAAFLVFAVVLAFSRFGRVRLGADDDRPEFRTVSWVAMMFSAGMGIGLMFFAVAEPISHMTAPPAGTARPGSEAAAQQAMAISYFHWALHPWAIYAIVGLALAYFTFRRGMPNLISSAFYPLLGDRVNGPIGRSIDILAIFATCSAARRPSASARSRSTADWTSSGASSRPTASPCSSSPCSPSRSCCPRCPASTRASSG